MHRVRHTNHDLVDSTRARSSEWTVENSGSPMHPALRTFVWAWFELPKTSSRGISSDSTKRLRRNPIALAQAAHWGSAMGSVERTAGGAGQIREFAGAGDDTIMVCFASWDQPSQWERFEHQVWPEFAQPAAGGDS